MRVAGVAFGVLLLQSSASGVICPVGRAAVVGQRAADALIDENGCIPVPTPPPATPPPVGNAVPPPPPSPRFRSVGGHSSVPNLLRDEAMQAFDEQQGTWWQDGSSRYPWLMWNYGSDAVDIDFYNLGYPAGPEPFYGPAPTKWTVWAWRNNRWEVVDRRTVAVSAWEPEEIWGARVNPYKLSSRVRTTAMAITFTQNGWFNQNSETHSQVQIRIHALSFKKNVIIGWR